MKGGARWTVWKPVEVFFLTSLNGSSHQHVTGLAPNSYSEAWRRPLTFCCAGGVHTLTAPVSFFKTVFSMEKLNPKTSTELVDATLNVIGVFI